MNMLPPRDITKSHETADRLRGYKPIGEYEAVYYNGVRYLRAGDIVDYYTDAFGNRTVVINYYGVLYYKNYKDVQIICPAY